MNNYEIREKEKKIMFALYRLSEASVGNLAKETLINRTTLYPILNRMLSKGLVSKIQIEDKTIYKPLPLEDFKDWAESKKEKDETENAELLTWISSQKTRKQKTLLSDISYFEGEEGVKKLYADTWRNNNEKLIYCLTDYKNALETMGNFFRNEYFPQRIKHGVKVRNLVPDSEEGRKAKATAKQLLRELKFIKLFEDLEIEINIYDDKLVIVAFDKEKPSGVLIKNGKIASAMKNIFEYLWRNVKL